MLTAGIMIIFYNVAMIKTEVYINGGGIECMSDWSPSGLLKRIKLFLAQSLGFCPTAPLTNKSNVKSDLSSCF